MASIQRLMLAGASALLAFSASSAEAQDILIGQTLSLTGPTAAIAKELMAGRIACADLVNSQGGIRNRPLKLVTADDQGDPSKAVRMARDLADKEGVIALLGSMGPAVNSAVLEWASAAGMTVIGPHGGDIESRVRGFDTAYFLTANQSAEAERLAAHVVSLGLTRVVIVHASDAAGRAALNALEEGLDVANVAPMVLVAVKPDGGDASLAAQALAKTNAQAVLLATSGKATIAMLKALSMTAPGEAPLLQVYGLSSSASQADLADLAELGAKAHGFSMSQVMPLPRDGRRPVVATFLQAMRNVPGERTYAELEGCMSSLLLAEVLRRKPPVDLTRAGILKGFRSAGRVNLGGFDVDLADRAQPGSRYTDIVYVSADGRISR